MIDRGLESSIVAITHRILGACKVVSYPLTERFSCGDLLFPGGIVCETAAPEPHKRKLLDQVRDAIRARHYSRRTEECRVGWIRRFIVFHGKRHPMEMGEAEITAFLSALAVKARVSASTQNQALSALLFLYRKV